MADLSTSDIKAILQAEKSDALSAMQATKLSEERTKALDYYMGDMAADMPSPPDRSKAVSTDVADTVEGLMPSLMEIFAGGDEVVLFEPVGQEDEEAAQQETDYVNHVFMQKNPGFLVLYSFIKDALLQKVGIVKVWWEEKEQEESETYIDVTDDVYGILASSEEVEIAEHTEHEQPGGVGPDGVPMPAQMLHDVTVVKRKQYGCARVEPVPPEEFGISRRAKSIKDSGYCFHEVRRSQADLIADGFDKEQIQALPTAGFDSTEEAEARNTVDETEEAGQAGLNKANRLLKVTEHYVMLDRKGDGTAKLHRVTTGGEASEILKRNGKEDIEPVDMAPFAAMTPVIMTHRFFGRSIADLVMDIQRIKTALLRSLLDNAYMANNQRIEIAESHASSNSIDDLLNNRPGGIVRTKQPGGLMPIPNQPIGNFAFPLIEYMDATREWRTGVTKQGQGLDPNALQNIGENAVLDASNAARARTKLIARIFAETGIRDLFSLVHATIRKNDRKGATVRLRNKWVPVDPRQWKTRTDMTITVGLGSGSKEQQMAFLLNLLGIQKEGLMAPQTGLVKPGNVYHTLKKLVELGGLRSVDPYFTDPDATGPDGQPLPKPEAPPNPEIEKAKINAQTTMQVEQMKAQISIQSEQQKAELASAVEERKLAKQSEIERLQAEADVAVKDREVNAQIMLKEREFQFQAELATQKFQHEMALKEREMQLKQDQAAIDNALRQQEMKDKAKAERSKPRPNA